MAIKSFKVEKLIRDRLPVILRGRGITVHDRIMEHKEFVHKLKEKLLEEAQEVNRAQNSEELVEELADILEVVQALSQATGLTLQQIEEQRIKKPEVKGGFDGKIFNHSIDMEEENEAIAYYLKKAEHYPQINIPAYSSDCLFCQISQGQKQVPFFAKFKHCYAIKDQFPVSEGHILIIPYEHTENWFTASEEVRLDILKALNNVKERIDNEYNPQGYNMGANCGEAAGQSVMHLHMHLIPRYQGDMENPKGGVRGVIPSKQKY